MKNHFLLTVQDAGQIYVRGKRRPVKKFKNCGKTKSRNDLQVLLIHIIKVIEPGAYSQRMDNDIFPVVLIDQRPNFFADCGPVQCLSCLFILYAVD